MHEKMIQAVTITAVAAGIYILLKNRASYQLLPCNAVIPQPKLLPAKQSIGNFYISDQPSRCNLRPAPMESRTCAIPLAACYLTCSPGEFVQTVSPINRGCRGTNGAALASSCFRSQSSICSRMPVMENPFCCGVSCQPCVHSASAAPSECCALPNFCTCAATVCCESPICMSPAPPEPLYTSPCCNAFTCDAACGGNVNPVTPYCDNPIACGVCVGPLACNQPFANCYSAQLWCYMVGINECSPMENFVGNTPWVNAGGC